MNTRWLTVDCYGTLIDWERGIRKAYGGILNGRGLKVWTAGLSRKYIEAELEVQPEGYRSYREVLSEASRRLFLAEFTIQLDACEAEALAGSLPTWPVFPDVPEALRKLKKRFKLAILSNIDDDLLANSIETLGVSFDERVTAQQIRSYKPGPAHWHEALKRFGVDKGRVLHVAASLVHDIRPASDLGFRCAWINRKHEKLPLDLKPSWVLPDLHGLPGKLGFRNPGPRS